LGEREGRAGESHRKEGRIEIRDLREAISER
jgi:hypothetical protein